MLRSMYSLLGCLLGIGCLNAATAQATPPNVVLILADDLGWSDLGCYGADFHETPRIDGFARQSQRFTEAYAMSVCSPSRAALLTGQHAARLHITIWAEGSQRGPLNRRLLQGESLHDLPHSEITLAHLLQSAGYLTALVGKWHLGGATHYPETHGFDINIGGTLWGAPQTFFWPYRGQGRFGTEYRYVPHLEFGETGEYLTDRLTSEAIRVIDRRGQRPFFLYLAHHAPHTPIEAKPEDVAYFQGKLNAEHRHRHPTYAAMIKSFDESVGRILDHLEQSGLADDTIVILTSDNGGFIGKDKGQAEPVTLNDPLRSGKGSLYEGGIRVPLIIRWPGVTAPGSECAEPVVLMDLFPTLLNAASASTEATPIDGLDLKPVLKNPQQKLPREFLYFHYPHYYETTTPVSAIRARDWKLLEYFEDGHVELYHLPSDLGEQQELSKSEPAKAARLQQQLADWRTAVRASLPTPNPDPRSEKK
jgi:arylsulfatase A